MLCRYCGKSLRTVEGNLGTVHQCTAPLEPRPQEPATRPTKIHVVKDQLEPVIQWLDEQVPVRERLVLPTLAQELLDDPLQVAPLRVMPEPADRSRRQAAAPSSAPGSAVTVEPLFPALFVDALLPAEVLALPLDIPTDPLLTFEPLEFPVRMEAPPPPARPKPRPKLQEVPSPELALPEIAEWEFAATAAFSAGDYAAAAAACGLLTDIAPAHFEAWFNLGVAEQKQGSLHAVAAFRAAVRLRPKDPHAWQALGMALHPCDAEGAKGAYTTALDLAPEMIPSMWNLGLIAEKSGDTVEAGRMVSKLMELQPERQDLRYRRALLQARAGDFEAAVAGLDDPAPYLRLGALGWRLGDYDLAGKCFEEMLHHGAAPLLALRAMAAAAIRQCDFSRALDLHRSLSDAGDRSFEVRSNRALLERANA
ncbi:MAG TPA: tetratricopeptide repeat protein [Bryobacteraceae bacterium]|nr:tetratricopeptide repeat protein [Bryobacteraceae bacterium]